LRAGNGTIAAAEDRQAMRRTWTMRTQFGLGESLRAGLSLHWDQELDSQLRGPVGGGWFMERRIGREGGGVQRHRDL
jgi:hypothetical protein